MRRSNAQEKGFTIIEVVVAVFVLTMAALATFGLLSSAAKNTERAKATQVALDRAQQEMEALRGLTSEQLAMTAVPPPSGDPLNPDYRVSGGEFALARDATSQRARMVVNGGEIWGEPEKVIEGGLVSPGPTSFASGDVSGKVYRYIVWRNDERCSEACPGTQDYKQIVIAVKLDKPGNQAAERGYVEVQSDFIDPTDSAAQDPSTSKAITAQQFFLSDTPCSKEANGTTIRTERQEITGDHLLHNTLGTCASGVQKEVTPGAPDALLLSRPPDVLPDDPSLPLLYDYSNDSYLEPSPNTDKGVQILRDEKIEGCHYDPAKETTSPHPDAEVHRWVTDPMKSTFIMTSPTVSETKVTIEFYTRTMDDVEKATGTLCVYLFKRHETGTPPEATDTLLINKNGGTKYWTFTPESNEYWPRLTWTMKRLTMTLNDAPYEIPEGDRLGVAISVERKNTQTEAIPVMYDHPDDPTRIEVDTSTPIEGG